MDFGMSIQPMKVRLWMWKYRLRRMLEAVIVLVMAVIYFPVVIFAFINEKHKYIQREEDCIVISSILMLLTTIGWLGLYVWSVLYG